MGQDEMVGFPPSLAGLEAELDERTRELAQSEARFRDVIEHNADAIVVLDQHGMIRFANSAADALLGQSGRELRGTAFGYPCAGGETTELDITRDGATRVVEMRVVDSAWEGEPACIASLRDMTERTQAEEAARRLIQEQAARSAAESSAVHFRFLAESSTILSSTLDLGATLNALADVCVTELADWTVVYLVEEDGKVSRGAVAHRDPDKAALARELREYPAVAGRLDPVVTALSNRRSVLKAVAQEADIAALAQGTTELELMQGLGVASYMLVPMVAHDRVIGALALVSARAERRFDTHDLALVEDLALRAALAVDNARLYRFARAANQAKTDYLAVISHDLRTPLNSIIGHADLLAMGIPERLGEATNERVGRIRASATHLLRLIDELLTWVRLDTGRDEVHVEDILAGNVVRDAGSVVELLAAERGLELIIDVPDEPVRISTDAAKLHQVLLNLVANAVKYTERGFVRVSVASQESTVVFTVTDSGIGIATEYVDRIFEPFWQVDRARVTDGGGTGLGLSVVQRLVRLLGGEVHVTSAVGEGSTFIVVIPSELPPQAGGSERD